MSNETTHSNGGDSHGERLAILETKMTTLKETCEKLEHNSNMTNSKLDAIGSKVYIGLGILIAIQFVIEVVIPFFHKS